MGSARGLGPELAVEARPGLWRPRKFVQSGHWAAVTVSALWALDKAEALLKGLGQYGIVSTASRLPC